jgi:hypothetical protein
MAWTITMTGTKECKLKLKETTSTVLSESFDEKLQIAESSLRTEKSSTLKSPVKNERESKPAQSNEKEKEIKWRRDIRF